MKITSNQTSNMDGGVRGFGQETGGQGKTINSLEPGDKFKATVTDIQLNRVTLKLSGGETLTAKSLILPDARIGEDSIFLVKENFKGQILLEMLKPDENSYQSNIAKEALINAEMYVDDENVELTKLLMRNNLPVDAQTLQKAAFFKYSEPTLTPERLLFLMKEEFPATEKSIYVLNNIMDNTLRIKDSLESLTADIFKIPTGEARKDIIRIALGLKEGVDMPAPERERLERLIESAFNDKAGKIRNTNHETEGKAVRQEEVKNHIRELANEIGRRFFVDLKSEDSHRELKKFYGRLEEITDKITEYIKGSEKLAPMSERLADVKDSIRFMNQIDKYKEYVQIPFSVDGTRNQGDIFIFRDSKGSKNYHENASVLIALENGIIGRVEVFVNKRFNDLTLNFRAEQDLTVKLISEKVIELVHELEQKGYTVSGFGATKLMAPSSLTDLPEPESGGKNSPKRYSFDMRA